MSLFVLQHFNAIGWAAAMASGLKKYCHNNSEVHLNCGLAQQTVELEKFSQLNKKTSI